MKFEKHPEEVKEIMVSNLVSISENASVKKALAHFRNMKGNSRDEPNIHDIYVVDKHKHLVGVVPLVDLWNASPDKSVSELMNKNVDYLKTKDDPEYAADLIQKLDKEALPVVNDENRLVGAVRFDDIMDVEDEEFSEDMYRLAGMSFTSAERARSSAILESSISTILKLRMPWLIVALLGGLLAGFVVDTYEATLEATFALAIFIPAIMDMGGNVGTQSSTIFVRGTALGQISEKEVVSHVAKEAMVGLLIGLLVGGFAGVAAFLWQGNLALGLVIFLSLTLTCMIASTLGYVVPWVAHKLGFDPAAISDPFITTIKDVSALMIYFSLAAALIPMI